LVVLDRETSRLCEVRRRTGRWNRKLVDVGYVVGVADLVLDLQPLLRPLERSTEIGIGESNGGAGTPRKRAKLDISRALGQLARLVCGVRARPIPVAAGNQCLRPRVAPSIGKLDRLVDPTGDELAIGALRPHR